MEKVQKTLRLHLAIFGRVNAGKSSFLNLVAGQNIAITSDVAGTTTDIVEKNQELIPLGPVVWMDTAGLGDETPLGRQRMEKSLKALDKADVVVLVCAGNNIGAEEQEIIAACEQRRLPMIKIFNKADILPHDGDGIPVNSLDLESRDKVLNLFKEELLKKMPPGFFDTPPLISDLVSPHSTVILVIPIDEQAPKARLLPLQVHVIRDCLDHACTVLSVKDSEYAEALAALKQKPGLVITDSSVVDMVTALTPEDIPCTTFSILFARMKGDLPRFAQGAKAIRSLQDGDKVLMAESCTHHAAKNDTGTVKIPRLLQKVTGKNLNISHVAGCDFPNDLASYRLVIQCGGCMTTRREMLSRIRKCEEVGVAITNYGVCISELQGVLSRVIKPFGIN